jgi:hypothetical protein
LSVGALAHLELDSPRSSTVSGYAVSIHTPHGSNKSKLSHCSGPRHSQSSKEEKCGSAGYPDPPTVLAHDVTHLVLSFVDRMAILIKTADEGGLAPAGRGRRMRASASLKLDKRSKEGAASDVVVLVSIYALPSRVSNGGILLVLAIVWRELVRTGCIVMSLRFLIALKCVTRYQHVHPPHIHTHTLLAAGHLLGNISADPSAARTYQKQDAPGCGRCIQNGLC